MKPFEVACRGSCSVLILVLEWIVAWESKMCSEAFNWSLDGEVCL